MEATVIDWDGSNLPAELRQLPPGRYVVSPIDDLEELSADEDAAVRKGLDDIEAGRVVSFDAVRRDLESRFHRS